MLTRCVDLANQSDGDAVGVFNYVPPESGTVYVTVGLAADPPGGCQVVMADSLGRAQLTVSGQSGTPEGAFSSKGATSRGGFIAVAQLHPSARRWNAHLDDDGTLVPGAPAGEPPEGSVGSADQRDPCDPSSSQFDESQCLSGSPPLAAGAEIDPEDSAFAFVPRAPAASDPAATATDQPSRGTGPENNEFNESMPPQEEPLAPANEPERTGLNADLPLCATLDRPDSPRGDEKLKIYSEQSFCRQAEALGRALEEDGEDPTGFRCEQPATVKTCVNGDQVIRFGYAVE